MTLTTFDRDVRSIRYAHEIAPGSPSHAAVEQASGALEGEDVEIVYEVEGGYIIQGVTQAVYVGSDGEVALTDIEEASATAKRNYRKEYDEYHAKPSQKKNRAARNAARSEKGLKVGDKREVDHKKPLSKGGDNEPDNLRVVSRDTNRSKGDSEESAVEETISRADLGSLERALDKLFAAAGIDVEFTKHFMDRVNDARNERDITIEELAGLFRETWKQHRKTLEHAKPDWNAILQDVATDINIPIVMDVNRYGEVELVAKTVMRKRGFTGRAKRLRVKSEDVDEMATELLPLKGELSRMVQHGGRFSLTKAREYIKSDPYVRFDPTDRQIAQVLKRLGGKKVGSEFVFEETDEGINDKYILKAVFMTGGAGAGKSFISDVMFGGSGLKVVNSDSQLEAAMKKAGLDMKKDMASLQVQAPGGLRDQAKAVTGKRLDLYVKGRLGLVIDSTAAKVGKVKGQVATLRALGYDCSMVFVNTALQTALLRNEARPRMVPVAVATADWNKVQKNLAEYRSLFGASNFRVVENDEVLSPREVVAKLTPQLTRTAMPLLNKPVKNPVGKKWMESQRHLAASAEYADDEGNLSEDAILLLGLAGSAVAGAVLSKIAIGAKRTVEKALQLHKAGKPSAAEIAMAKLGERDRKQIEALFAAETKRLKRATHESLGDEAESDEELEELAMSLDELECLVMDDLSDMLAWVIAEHSDDVHKVGTSFGEFEEAVRCGDFESAELLFEAIVKVLPLTDERQMSTHSRISRVRSRRRGTTKEIADGKKNKGEVRKENRMRRMARRSRPTSRMKSARTSRSQRSLSVAKESVDERTKPRFLARLLKRRKPRGGVIKIHASVEDELDEVSSFDTKAIKVGMARAMFVDWWASEEERKTEDDPDYELPWGPGSDLMDAAPKTSANALRAAVKLAKRFEALNKMTVEALFERAVEAGGEDDSRLFGHYLAMRALGHGVSWEDSNPESGIKYPDIEYYESIEEMDAEFHDDGAISVHQTDDVEDAIVNEVSPPGWEARVKKMKRDPDIKNPWQLAWYLYNKEKKGGGKKESTDEARLSSKDPMTMTAAQINKELDKLDGASSKLTTSFIEAGRGHEKFSDIAKAKDPLALEMMAVTNRQSSLRDEGKARYGPKLVGKLPTRGFGPRKRNESIDEARIVTDKWRVNYGQGQVSRTFKTRPEVLREHKRALSKTGDAFVEWFDYATADEGGGEWVTLREDVDEAEGIVITSQWDKRFGSALRMRIGGLVGGIGIRGEVRPLKVGLERDGTLAMADKDTTVNRSDGSGTALPAATRRKVVAAVFAERTKQAKLWASKPGNALPESLDEGLRPGKMFVIVDTSVPGGRMVGEIITGVKIADAKAKKLRDQGRDKLQVIDALWYGPAREKLIASGVIAEDSNAHGVSFNARQLLSMWEEEDEATRGTFEEWRAQHFTVDEEVVFYEGRPFDDSGRRTGFQTRPHLDEAAALDLKQFEKMGAAAFKAGKMAVPAHDPKVMQAIKRLSKGKPVGFSINILDAWTRGWTTANLKAPVEGTDEARMSIVAVKAMATSLARAVKKGWKKADDAIREISAAAGSIGDDLLRAALGEDIELAEHAAQYKTLNDAAHYDALYAKGRTEIWYMRDATARVYGMGLDYVRKQESGAYPTKKTYQTTHKLVGKIKQDNPERVFGMMQGERWSPDGEARTMLGKLGLHHTSMSVGDIIKTGTRVLFVDRNGFVPLD